MKLLFETREDFRDWLKTHKKDDEGVWLIFGKKKGPKTLTSEEALEEALCFGWIDGLIKKVDDLTYIKYFKKRLKKSNWSEKNRNLIKKLLKENKMTPAGLLAVEAAKKEGTWKVEKEKISEQDISDFMELLKSYELAKNNFINMSPSVQKAYTGFYLSAKREETRNKRLKELINRFEKNLKPMERE